MRQDKGRQETSCGRARTLEEAVCGSLGESADKGKLRLEMRVYTLPRHTPTALIGF